MTDRVLGYFQSRHETLSPDGRYFFFISQHGDLACDCNVYRLEVFFTEDCRRVVLPLLHGSRPSVRAVAAITFSAPYSSGAAIRDARWGRDGGGILFLAPDESGGGEYQIYRLEVPSGGLEQLTHESGRILCFDYRGGGLVFSVARDGLPVLPGDAALGLETLTYVFAVYRGVVAGIVNVGCIEAAWVSPDGCSAVVLAVDSGGGREFVLVDLKCASVAQVSGREARDATMPAQALWTSDGMHVVLVNVATAAVGADGVLGASLASVAAYDLVSGSCCVLEPLVQRDVYGRRSVISVAWVYVGQELLITHETDGKPDVGIVYTSTEGTWRARTTGWMAPVTESMPHIPGMSVENRYSVSVRPGREIGPAAVVASDGRLSDIVDEPSPDLRRIKRAYVESFEWREPDGELVTGGLLLPTGDAITGPVPLVIQVSCYCPLRDFPSDGSDPEFVAAQALAARGMAVLLTAGVSVPGLPTVEGRAFVERIDSAVEALANRRIVDPKRVGLVGFSRGGYQVFYAITHPGRTKICAAVCIDAFSGSYVVPEHSGNGHAGDVMHDLEFLYGGTFWQNKNAWLEHDATFNVDRIRTPTLFAVTGRRSLSSERSIEPIARFVLNSKPIEFLCFPRGTQPRESLNYRPEISHD